MKIPVFDLHCDTSDLLAEGQSLRKNRGHIDLERAKIFSSYAQCFASFTSPDLYEDPKKAFFEKKEALSREISKNSDSILPARSGEEIAQNDREGKMSAIFTIEGTAGFDFSPMALEGLFEEGFRISTLGWNEKNPLVGSHITGGGLTDRGRDYAREAERLGIFLDVSHISDEGFWDLVKMAKKPILATHSNSRAVCNHSRNLTDDQFLAIKETGGLVGINLYSAFLGENADFDTVCRHILHFLELDPEGEHIALGGDLDGCDSLPIGFSGVQDYPKLFDALLKCYLSEKTVLNIFWNNAFRLFSKTE